MDRLPAEFVVELLGLVPSTLVVGPGSKLGNDIPFVAGQRGRMLDHAFIAATKLTQPNAVSKLVDTFITLAESTLPQHRPGLINRATPSCLFSLKSLGLRQELERLLPRLEQAVRSGVSLSGWRQRYIQRPEEWGGVLLSAMKLVPGWFDLGLVDRAQPILAETRRELADQYTTLRSGDYTEVAGDYLNTMATGTNGGLEMLIDSFGLIQPNKVTNTFTTAQFYSRLHLQLVESVVFAACRYCLENPVPVTVTA